MIKISINDIISKRKQKLTLRKDGSITISLSKDVVPLLPEELTKKSHMITVTMISGKLLIEIELEK